MTHVCKQKPPYLSAGKVMQPPWVWAFQTFFSTWWWEKLYLKNLYILYGWAQVQSHYPPFPTNNPCPKSELLSKGRAYLSLQSHLLPHLASHFPCLFICRPKVLFHLCTAAPAITQPPTLPSTFPTLPSLTGPTPIRPLDAPLKRLERPSLNFQIGSSTFWCSTTFSSSTFMYWK